MDSALSLSAKGLLDMLHQARLHLPSYVLLLPEAEVDPLDSANHL